MAFRHVAMLRWRPDASAEDRAAALAAIRALPGVIDSIRGYEVGEDAGVGPGNHDLVIVADFDDVDGYIAYRDHPEHRRVIAELVAPLLEHRAAVQHER
jgi:hypothetical protein